METSLDLVQVQLGGHEQHQQLLEVQERQPPGEDWVQNADGDDNFKVSSASKIVDLKIRIVTPSSTTLSDQL